MMFKTLEITNFGIFRGRHTIDLSVEPGKPVVLIGALNGSGKTTFLDAVRLALYGKYATLSNRGRMAYGSYLKKSRNKFASPKEASEISLGFETGQGETIHIKRIWNGDVDLSQDQFLVHRDGLHDDALTARWDDAVHEFFPLELSELFQFDGEKIEFFAEPKNTAKLIDEGLTTLLGLGVVGKSVGDLAAVKKKYLKMLPEVSESAAYLQAQDAVAQVEERLARNEQLIEELQGKVDLNNTKVNKLKRDYEAKGGGAFERKREIELQASEVAHQLESAKNEARGFLAGVSPLKLLKDDLTEIISLNRDTSKSAAVRELEPDLREVFASLADGSDAAKKLQALLEMSSEGSLFDWRISHIDHVIEDIENDYLGVEASLAKIMQLDAKLEQLNESLLTVPDQADVIDLVQALEQAKVELKLSVNELDETRTERLAIEKDLAVARQALEKRSAEFSKAELSNIMTKMILERVDRASEVLGLFGKHARSEYISKLEQAVLDSLTRLFRKDGFVERVSIDPNTCVLTLFEPMSRIEGEDGVVEEVTGGGHALDVDRLSAGERQLVAIAIVWGLASCSAKLLPAIIDTPLGRLDGEHRKHLVQNYFPSASSQVILLSTDEEINTGYYHMLKGWVSREYELSFDKNKGSSYFTDGYPFAEVV
jgi:DNA sulfur modification protein DndD